MSNKLNREDLILGVLELMVDELSDKTLEKALAKALKLKTFYPDSVPHLIYNLLEGETRYRNQKNDVEEPDVELDALRLAECWSDAYSADRLGRTGSVAIIQVMFEHKISLADAKDIYYSKWIRWFCDRVEGSSKLTTKKIKEEFTKYLADYSVHMRDMIDKELHRKPSW